MKKIVFMFFVYLIPLTCFCQVNQAKVERANINKTIINFLKWYKVRLNDTARKSYVIAKGGFPDTTTQRRISWDGVEMYLNEVKKSNFFTDGFIDAMRRNFERIDSIMVRVHPGSDLNKIPGMDADFVFPTYEPESFLDHIDKAEIRKLHVLNKKARVSMNFSKYTNLVFTLTKGENKRWYIDYMGYDDPNLYHVLK